MTEKNDNLKAASSTNVGPIRKSSQALNAAGIWKAEDPLGAILHHLRMDGVFYGVSEFSAPWGLAIPPMPDCILFHVVMSGSGMLITEDKIAHPLKENAFALVSMETGYTLASDKNAKATDLFDTTRYVISDKYELMVHGGGGAPSRMVCGAVRLEHPAARRLIALLPDIMVVDQWSDAQIDTVDALLKLLAEEASHPRPGGEAIITRLADILVIEAIRAWMTSKSEAGWLGALKDPKIGKALASIHASPEILWTVEDLADVASMSRSAFSAKFSELVGESPMQYARAWKMNIAVDQLKHEGVTITDVAYQLGYESEAAFSRAFKKVMGFAPGAVKRGH